MIRTLSSRIERLKASPIRDILSVAGQPGIISFAGGLPEGSTFPDVGRLTAVQSDLQYGPTEGEPRLRSCISEQLYQRGLHVEPSQVLVLSGSQQGIDLVAKLLIDVGTSVAVESPTYLAALQVFSLFGACYQPYQIDDIASIADTANPALLYSIPTFQNPSSYVYTTEQRMALAQLCDYKNTVLFEDDPYRDLAYEPCDRTPVCSFVKHTSWVYQSSFSKTIAPGLRLGYLACSKDLLPHLVKLKQAADLHSCRLSQRSVLRLLNDDTAGHRLNHLQVNYKMKRDAFNASLLRHFADIATWQVPAGGLFFWLTLRHPLSVPTTALLKPAIDAGVTFMPGEPFFADGRPCASCFRLNFSHTQHTDFDRGLALLAAVFKQYTTKY